MKFFLKLTFLLILSASVFSGSAQNAVKRYIAKYDDLAVGQMKKHEIPASIILGVSIVESAAGQSMLAKALNNYFGVKGKNTSSQQKLGYKSKYKEYESDEASYEHFCQILRNKSFYEKLKGTTDYKQWLFYMNKANYATAKGEWVRKIILAIDKYKLYEYDKL